MSNYKRVIPMLAIFVFAILFLKSFAQQSHPKKDEDAAENLKILPKNISDDSLHAVMRIFSKSLGVKCGHCHVSTMKEGNPRPTFNFSSDDKPEKNIARKMMTMVDSINTNFITKMGDNFERITCVTCHHGSITPMVSVDSLMKN